MADVIGYETLFADKGGPSTKKNASGSGAAAQANFSSSLAAWREIQLPALQADLETLRPTLIEAQKDALLSRKKLAEQTREFKKLETDAQPEAIKPLLKAYQAEIDSLTKRAKAAENAVLGVRDRLQTASDPYPILELVLEQTAVMEDVQSLKDQVKKLQSDNATLERQLASLPSIEAERSRLASRVSQLESSASEARKNIEAELAAKWDERIRNHKAREENLTKSLETTQGQLAELRANYAKVTERLLHHGEEVEREHTNGKIEELDMISEELSRSNERAAAMERRNEQLRQEIERLKSGLGEDQRIAELEQRAFDAEEESRRLGKLLDDEGKKVKATSERSELKVHELATQLREKERENEGLRRRVMAMSDYDEIKRELEIFKYVEFAVESDRQLGDEDRSAQANGSAETSSAAKPLEALLIEKNRQLQDELTGLRVAHGELNTSAGQAKQDLQVAQNEMARLKKLNERLEDDLVNVKPGQSHVKAATVSAEEALAEMDKIGKEAGTYPIAGDRSGSGAVAPSAKSVEAEAGATSLAPAPFEGAAKTSASSSFSSSSSILPIITSQRDRFRARNAELEEELRKQFASITELRNEVKTLQADNLSLYEKVRYLQAYHASGSLGASGARTNPGGSRLVNIAARNDYGGNSYPPTMGEDKYREKYEASMNPFEQFRGRVGRALFNIAKRIVLTF